MECENGEGVDDMTNWSAKECKREIGSKQFRTPRQAGVSIALARSPSFDENGETLLHCFGTNVAIRACSLHALANGQFAIARLILRFHVVNSAIFFSLLGLLRA